MGAVLTITAKDLRLRVRDRSVLLYGVVAPLVLAVVLGGVFGSIEEGISIDLGYVHSADDANADGFIDEVVPQLMLDGLIASSVSFDDEAAAIAAVEAGTVDAVAVFAPGGIEVLGDVGTPTFTGIVEAIVATTEQRGAALGAVLEAAGAAGQPVSVAEARAALAAVSGQAELTARPAGFAALDATTYLSAGMAVFFLLFAVGIAVTGLIEEERDRTLARLVTAPIPRWSPVAAKALGALVLGTGSMGLLAVATSLLVGARWGSPFLLALLIPAAAFAATGVVSLVASVAHRPESATSIQGVVGTVMGVLGGAFFPVSGGLLGALSLLTPHRWFLDGLTDVAGGGALREVAPEIAVLLAMGLATGALATRRFSVRLGA